MKFEIQMAVPNGQKAHHTISGKILMPQIRQILKTVVQKFQSANYQIAESPNRRGANFDRIANCEALPRDSARFRQPW